MSAGVPVDPVRIARALGVRVVDTRLDDGISGALMKERERDAAIVLNSRDRANTASPARMSWVTS